MTEEEDPFSQTRMTLGEHLEELRRRLIKGLAAIALAFIGSWILRDHVVEIVTLPYYQAMGMLEAHYVEEAEGILAEDPERERTDFFLTAEPGDQRLRNLRKELVWIKPAESFIFLLKICLYTAVVIGAPILLWQMWMFISAGLYNRERKAITKYFPISVLAFAVGVLFGYFAIVPYGMYFLNRAVSIEIGTPSITVHYYLTFISSLCLAFGVVFQLPLLMTFLGAVGIVDPADMGKYRGHFIVAAFVIAAMLTPPDPFTQLMMAVPLVVLYEVGIWSARVAARGQATSGESDPGVEDGADASGSEA